MTWLRTFVAALLLAAGFATFPAAAGSAEGPASALQILDYVAVDYPEAVEAGQVANESEYAEQVEFVGRVVQLIGGLPGNAAKAELLTRARALEQLVRQRAPGTRVATQARSLAAGLTHSYGVATAPARAPHLSGARQLFEAQCARCHGAGGGGDGPLAAAMQPAPANFRDRHRQFERSLYSLYNTITHGVPGTAMPAFTRLSDAQRWALAFYVGSLPFSDAERAAGEKVWRQSAITDLESLTRTLPREAEQQGGTAAVDALAYLRSEPAALGTGEAAGSALHRARVELDRSLALYREGQPREAYTAALSAYLDGFELAESGVAAVDPALKGEIEGKMLEYRQQIQNGAPVEALASRHAGLQTLLGDAAERIGSEALQPAVGFAGALVILLREGLEAILVLAAIAAVLIRSGRRDALRYLHVGWISALLLGGVTWAASAYVLRISGAGRELTEGVTALVATAVLLYVGFWLHGKTHAVRWRKFVEAKIQKALHGRALWMLTAVAFLAVYREVFETVLFYQALWLQAAPETGPYIWLGIGVAALSLLLLAWLILRSSMRLPLKAFFTVNAAIMLLLAVAFAGHGIAALQEAGVLGVDTLPFPRLELLGIYPTAQSLGVQAAVLALIAGVFLYERRSRQRLAAQ